jgi:hypothetical protein
VARRRVVRRLEQAGAVSLEAAGPLDDLNRIESGRLARLLEEGAVHETQPGRYWLDRERYADYVRHRRRLAILALLAVLVALFFVVELAGRP